MFWGIRVASLLTVVSATACELAFPIVTDSKEDAAPLDAAPLEGAAPDVSTGDGSTSDVMNLEAGDEAGDASPSKPPIGLVQVTSAPDPVHATQVTVLMGPQTQGDTNIVVAGWSDTTYMVSAVTDTANNQYTLIDSFPFKDTKGAVTQAIYYAVNIAAASTNNVTVVFNGNSYAPDVRVAEYAGLSGVDQHVAAGGEAQSTASGDVTTSMAHELIFGAGSSYASRWASAGPGFMLRQLTSPDGNLIEDMIVSAIGSYNATATIDPTSNPGPWVMEVVTFY